MNEKRVEIKVITRLERRRSTTNGGPVYVVHFDDATSARTQSDAMFTYGFENSELRDRPVRVTFSRAGRIEDVEPFSSYRVNDVDPTPDSHDLAVDERYCGYQCEPVGMCTWVSGHAGQHVAGTGAVVAGVAG